MLIHCVFLAFRPEIAETHIAACMDSLSALTGKIDGLLSFAAGPNRDFEHKSPAHRHGFVLTCRDRAALAAYDAHPEHRAAGGWLVASCQGGADGIVVYDIEVAEPSQKWRVTFGSDMNS